MEIGRSRGRAGRARKLPALLVGACIAVTALVTLARAAGQDWNDAQIHWMPYEEGLAAAKKEGRPICLIFYTTWCPHCANYSKVFSDPAVVKMAQSFVMIRLDKDKNGELSKKYSPDGEYIPRTYFLSSTGQLDPTLSEDHPQYKYFYSERDPASILSGMNRALKKLK
jgi:thiol-disulfide isomerase/thioredoxin